LGFEDYLARFVVATILGNTRCTDKSLLSRALHDFGKNSKALHNTNQGRFMSFPVHLQLMGNIRSAFNILRFPDWRLSKFPI